MAHPLALQLRNLQTLVEISVDKNSTVIFPAPLMSTIEELGGFLNRETTAVGSPARRRRWWRRGATASRELLDLARITLSRSAPPLPAHP